MSKPLQFKIETGEPKHYQRFKFCLLQMVRAYLLVASSAFAGEQPQRLVIITHAHSRIEVLNYPLLRKIYLGSASAVGTRPVYPLINQSNSVIYEMFLQKVLFMSQNTYEHHLHHAKFPKGTVVPIAFRSEDKLLAYLSAHPGSITCLTEQAAAKMPSVRVVMRL